MYVHVMFNMFVEDDVLFMLKTTSRVNKTGSKQRKRQINGGKLEGLVVLGMPVTGYSLLWFKINIFYPCCHN